MPKLRDSDLRTFLNSVLAQQGYNRNVKYYDDPTTIGFSLNFVFEGKESPLFNLTGEGESAIRYLDSVGEGRRANLLKDFKDRLRDITYQYPYFFQKITGLGNFYQYNPNTSYDVEKKLTIDTLESIDLRISSFIDAYMRATFDEYYLRDLLPVNLRHFKVIITLSEIRKFRSFVENVVEGKVKDEMSMVTINDSISVYVIEYTDCMFDFSEANPWMNDISNAQTVEANNQFSIKTGRLKTRNKMRLMNLEETSVDDSSFVFPTLKTTDLSFQQDSLPQPSKTGLFDNVADKITGSVDGYKNVVNTIVQEKTGEFLQQNDPRNILGRTLTNKLDILDAKFKDFLFGRDDPNPMIADPNGLGQIDVTNDPVIANFARTIPGFRETPLTSLLGEFVRANAGNILFDGQNAG